MHLLCRLDDLSEGQPRGFSIGSHSLIALCHQQRCYVYLNRCPHRGVGLEWLPDRFLDPSGQYLQCATHGALFTLTEGRCVQGPCMGQSLTPVPCEVRDGQLWAMLPAPMAAALPFDQGSSSR